MAAKASTPKRLVRGMQSAQFLKLSSDRKVSPRGTWQAPHTGASGIKYSGRWVPTVLNSIALPPGAEYSCPGETEFCKAICYAKRSGNSQHVHPMQLHNLRLLLEAGTVEGMLALLDEMLGRYWAEAEILGLRPEERIFRWHWSGDFFSEIYAQACALVIQRYPGIRFLAYTRSFTAEVNAVRWLYGIPNLALYLSLDENNSVLGEQVARTYPGVRIAYTTKDFRTGLELAEGERPVRCPENAGKLALMDSDAEGNGRGACVSCNLCFEGRRNIMFASSHSEEAGVTVRLSRRTRGAPEQPQRYCHNPACRAPLPRGDGRRKWCQPRCRWTVLRQNERTAKPRAVKRRPAPIWSQETGARVADAPRRHLAPASRPTEPREAKKRGRPPYSEDALLEHLKTVTLYYQRLPTEIDLFNFNLAAGVGPGIGPYMRVYGSLPLARQAAGIPQLLADIEAASQLSDHRAST